MLKETRIKKNLTQKELAQISKISIRTIQNYECGHRNINNAPLSHLIDLANALGVNFYEILDKELKIKIKKHLSRF